MMRTCNALLEQVPCTFYYTTDHDGPWDLGRGITALPQVHVRTGGLYLYGGAFSSCWRTAAEFSPCLWTRDPALPAGSEAQLMTTNGASCSRISAEQREGARFKRNFCATVNMPEIRAPAFVCRLQSSARALSTACLI